MPETREAQLALRPSDASCATSADDFGAALCSFAICIPAGRPIRTPTRNDSTAAGAPARASTMPLTDVSPS